MIATDTSTGAVVATGAADHRIVVNSIGDAGARMVGILKKVLPLRGSARCVVVPGPGGAGRWPVVRPGRADQQPIALDRSR